MSNDEVMLSRLGKLTKSQLDRWNAFIAEHSSLKSAALINPFTKQPVPGFARVVVDETVVGSVGWDEEYDRIIVSAVVGCEAQVEPIAQEIATKLGLTFVDPEEE